MVKPAETSQTLGRGLQVLELLANSPRGLTVTELSEQLDIGRTVVYRLVTTLEQHQFAERDADGRVRLGWAALSLARSAMPQLRVQALPVLRTLADTVGATAHLTCAEGEEAVAVAVVEPRWTDMHVGYREGLRHPLTVGAAGKAILAARKGKPAVVRSTGELQVGAHGVAVVVALTGAHVELSVGVVALAPLSKSTDVAVRNAAASLASGFSRR